MRSRESRASRCATRPRPPCPVFATFNRTRLPQVLAVRQPNQVIAAQKSTKRKLTAARVAKTSTSLFHRQTCRRHRAQNVSRLKHRRHDLRARQGAGAFAIVERRRLIIRRRLFGDFERLSLTDPSLFAQLGPQIAASQKDANGPQGKFGSERHRRRARGGRAMV